MQPCSIEQFIYQVRDHIDNGIVGFFVVKITTKSEE